LSHYLDFNRTTTIATTIVHSKLDNSNHCSEVSCFQQIENSVAHAVVGTLNSVISLWLNIFECIEYKLPVTYKVLTATQPTYLHWMISFHPLCSTSSSSLVPLARPPTCSSLKITENHFHVMFRIIFLIHFISLILIVLLLIHINSDDDKKVMMTRKMMLMSCR